MKKYVMSTTEDYGFKGRYDIITSLKRIGYKEIKIKTSENPCILQLFNELGSNKKTLIKILNSIKNCELVFIYPWNSMSLVFSKLIKQYSEENNIKTYIFLVDINQERVTTIFGQLFFRYFVNEYKFFDNFDYIICHNDKMKKVIMSHGIDEKKIYSLGFFDYILDFDNKVKIEDFKKISIAGNLTKMKAGYAHKLKDLNNKNYRFELYGVYDGELSKNIIFKGSFDPVSLVKELNGGFGLVWDGNSIDKCDGKYGEYLRMNNPNKFSLYLACGIPIITWKEQALADFVIDNNIGFVVSSLEELDDLFKHLTKKQYKEFVDNVQKVNKKLINGEYVIDLMNMINSFIN